MRRVFVLLLLLPLAGCADPDINFGRMAPCDDLARLRTVDGDASRVDVERLARNGGNRALVDHTYGYKRASAAPLWEQIATGGSDRVGGGALVDPDGRVSPVVELPGANARTLEVGDRFHVPHPVMAFVLVNSSGIVTATLASSAPQCR